MFTQADRERLAAIAIERNKSPDRVAGGELFDVMLDSDAAVSLSPGEGEKLFPRIGEMGGLDGHRFRGFNARNF